MTSIHVLFFTFLLTFLDVSSARPVQTFTQDGGSKVVIIEPGVALKAQTISIGTTSQEVIRYRPQGLRPSRTYELRVSSPATMPAQITLWLEPRGSRFSRRRHHRRQSRKLLDAEKLVFSTGPEGGIIFNGREHRAIDVLMHAEPLTQHRDGPDKGIRSLVYDIVLEEDVLGVPVSALPIVITAVAAVIMCVIVLPWWAGAGAPKIVDWLLGGGSGGGKRRNKIPSSGQKGTVV